MRKMLFFGPLALVGFALFIALGGWAVMSLWNWLTPALFGWHTVTFWQALGLLALCRILFGGFRLGGGHRHMGGPWRFRMQGRWNRMSDEEKAAFRRRMRERFGNEVFDDAAGAGSGESRS